MIVNHQYSGLTFGQLLTGVWRVSGLRSSMAPNILEPDSSQLTHYMTDNYQRVNSDISFMHNFLIKSKHLIIIFISKVKLNQRINSFVDKFEQRFNSRQEFSNLYEIDDCLSNEKKREGKRRSRLLKITDMPAYLQFNPWIVNGYRSSKLSTLECIASLLYWHNETINILSHTLPLLYCMAFFSSMIKRQTINALVLSYCHCLGLVSCAVGSSLYHLFMNHKSGAKCYYRLLQCDMIGIWITQSVGALSTVYASVATLPLWFRYSFLALYGVLSLLSLREGIAANSAWKRPASFSLLFLMRLIAFGLRVHTDSVRNTAYIQWLHIIMQELWPLVGAILSATRIPERFWPGLFDYILNSHNIMHCFVVFGAIHMHLAFNNDLEWLSSNDQHFTA